MERRRSIRGDDISMLTPLCARCVTLSKFNNEGVMDRDAVFRECFSQGAPLPSLFLATLASFSAV